MGHGFDTPCCSLHCSIAWNARWSYCRIEGSIFYYISSRALYIISHYHSYISIIPALSMSSFLAKSIITFLVCFFFFNISGWLRITVIQVCIISWRSLSYRLLFISRNFMHLWSDFRYYIICRRLTARRLMFKNYDRGYRFKMIKLNEEATEDKDTGGKRNGYGRKGRLKVVKVYELRLADKHTSPSFSLSFSL